jgi:hypothetical protein
MRRLILLLVMMISVWHYPAVAETLEELVAETIEEETEEFSVSDDEEEDSDSEDVDTEPESAATIENLEEEAVEDDNYVDLAVLQGLNKITARISTLEVPLGMSINFGKLEIMLKLCWRSKQDEQPDSKALLEIWEHRSRENREQVFHGWMFASSPGLSVLEHPVYDITILECKKRPRIERKKTNN